jgi:hypothetical protein
MGSTGPRPITSAADGAGGKHSREHEDRENQGHGGQGNPTETANEKSLDDTHRRLDYACRDTGNR